MRVSLDPGAYTPIRAHATDAGLDIRSPQMRLLRANDSTIIRTGIHVELPEGTAGMLMSKSGLNTIHDITSTGLIDEGYGGEVVVKLYNHGADDYTIHVGDKITQLVVVPVRYVDVELVDTVGSGVRGCNGFGSTGR